MVWFGTCDFIVKTRGHIPIADSSQRHEDLVEIVLQQYRVLKWQILRANSSAKVVFVECPPISVQRWIEKNWWTRGKLH